MRYLALALLVAAVCTPAADAKHPTALSARAGTAAIVRYADREVKTGAASSYRLGRCWRAARRTVVCSTTWFEVGDGWGMRDQTIARRCGHRIRVWEPVFSDAPC